MQNINTFEAELKYKLYSNMEKIMHPSISKKNISSYKIVLDEKVCPIRVFYPEKVSNLEKIVIYIHGISKVSGYYNRYADICMDMAYKMNRLVIALDYDEKKNYFDCFNEILEGSKYLCAELERVGVSFDNISLMGDSIGAAIACGIDNELNISKCILISPILSRKCLEDGSVVKNDRVNMQLFTNLKKYYESSLRFKKDYMDSRVFPLLGKEFKSKFLIVVGENDFLKDYASDFLEKADGSIFTIPVVGHSFLCDPDLGVKAQFYKNVLEFLDEK